MGVVSKQSRDECSCSKNHFSCVFLILQENTKFSFPTPVASQSLSPPDFHQLKRSPDCSDDDDDDDVENWRSKTVPLTQSSGYHSGGMSEESISEENLESGKGLYVTYSSASNNVASYVHCSTTNGMSNICWHLPVVVCSDCYNSHDWLLYYAMHMLL